MKYLVLLVLLTACSTPREVRKKNLLTCTKDLLEYRAEVKNAYIVCKDLEDN